MEDDQRRIINEDTNQANQMRVQLQYKQQHDTGIALLAVPEVGVTKSQVYNGLFKLWNIYDSGGASWLPQSQARNVRRAIVEVSQKVKNRRGSVIAPREQVATSQWMPDGRQATRGDYRVDVENLRGENLKF